MGGYHGIDGKPTRDGGGYHGIGNPPELKFFSCSNATIQEATVYSEALGHGKRGGWGRGGGGSEKASKNILPPASVLPATASTTTSGAGAGAERNCLLLLKW